MFLFAGSFFAFDTVFVGCSLATVSLLAQITSQETYFVILTMLIHFRLFVYT